MGQSKSKWIFVYEDGTTETVECTFDELWEKLPLFGREPVAIIRGDFA